MIKQMDYHGEQYYVACLDVASNAKLHYADSFMLSEDDIRYIYDLGYELILTMHEDKAQYYGQVISQDKDKLTKIHDDYLMPLQALMNLKHDQ